MATSRQQFLLGSQLILRLLGVLFSIAVLALSAVYVVLGNAEDQVASNVASLLVLIICAVELRSLTLHYIHLRTPRFSPVVLFIGDVISTLFGTMSLVDLVQREKAGNFGLQIAEIWVSLFVVVVDGFCIVFDGFEWCALRARREENEIEMGGR